MGNNVKSTNISCNNGYSVSILVAQSSQFIMMTGSVNFYDLTENVAYPQLEVYYDTGVSSEVNLGYAFLVFSVNGDSNVSNLGIIYLYPTYIKFWASCTFKASHNYKFGMFGSVYKYA